MAFPVVIRINCLIIISLLSLLSQAQLRANFTATPLSGCVPLLVNFTDGSTGNPDQWKWDLGNGTNSSLQNPSVTYFNPGQYTVKLIVIKSGQKDSLVKNLYITAFAQPVVDFLADNLTGCYPLDVHFSNNSTAGSGYIDLLQWDFGDGTIVTTQNPVHTYTAAGNYNVSLRIRNSNGCYKTLTKNQFIKINSGVRAAFSANISGSCTAPVDVSFTNLSVGTGTLNYIWNFGDGYSSNAINPNHTYASPGVYTVSLAASNSIGCMDTAIHLNAINVGVVNTAFTMPDSVCVNKPVAIFNSSSPIPPSVYWSFGDGTVSNTFQPSKTYTSPGTYMVKLFSNYGACRDSAIRPITILPEPLSAFAGDVIVSCKTPHTVNFINNSSNAISYKWLFGDGTTSILPNPSHTYLSYGPFDVTLITINSAGCSDTLFARRYININAPVISIRNLPAEGCAPFSWSFSSTLRSPEPAISYAWDFGDGNTSILPGPTHVFSQGSYNISLAIQTSSGCRDTLVVPLGIKAGVKPHPSFMASPRDTCAQAPINFIDLSTGNPDKWLWKFGDGGSDTTRTPVHVYRDTGYFSVTLITWNNGCLDSIVFPDYIYIRPPVARFNMDDQCFHGNTRIFTDSSIGAATWHWDFGDGVTSSEQSPAHTYSATGDYQVTLTVTGNSTACTDISKKTVHISSTAPGFKASDTLFCKNGRTLFTSLSVDTASTPAFLWKFGDGMTGTGYRVIHTYTESGIYTVQLIIKYQNGCRDTITRQNYIEVAGPLSNFGVQGPGNCAVNTMHFRDSSVADAIHPITNWIWDYGDGSKDTLSAGPFQHSYANSGVYTISLKVTDNKNCSDTKTRNDYIVISKPLVSFTADTIGCNTTPVLFSNNSLGTGPGYIWSFGDGYTSTLANPSHRYNADGLYSVKLILTDTFGCIDSLIRPDYIRIVSPVADFILSDTAASCPPLVLNFTNRSQNYVSLNWDFGDGTSTPAINPSHFYSTPGTFPVSLTVTGPGNCTSVKNKTIILRGARGSFTYGGINGCSPYTVNFAATTPDRISFIWDFNDGSTLTTTDSIISHVYTVPGIYVPKLILRDTAGCMIPVTGTDTIHVNQLSAGFSYNTQVLCNSGIVSFHNSSSASQHIDFLWDFGDGITSIEENPQHYYSSPGIYLPGLISRTADCTDSANGILPIKIVVKPEARISQTPNGCTPLTVTFSGILTVPDTSSLQWNWKFGNGNTSNVQQPPPQTYHSAGNYPVTLLVTNSSGCKDTASSNVQTVNIPGISASNDILICKGSGTTLTANGGYTYTWTPSAGLSCANCRSPIAKPDTSTKYYVTGFTDFGCNSMDSVLVTVQPPFVMRNSTGDTLCNGKSVRLFASGAYSYVWSPSNGLSSTSVATPLASPSSTTTYRVIGSDDKNCFKDTAYVPVIIYPIPIIEAGHDITINAGQIAELIPVVSPDVSGVFWSPSASIVGRDHFSVKVKPNATTTYTAEAINDGGCKTTDNITVTILCSGANVFIPNTFSPNGDGINDVFYPRGSGLFTVRYMRIFNRWGEMVFERTNINANDASAGWDGTYKGRRQNPDVYVYIMEIICNNNTVLPYKGNVSLIK